MALPGEIEAQMLIDRKIKRYNSKHFLPLNEDFHKLFKNVINNKELAEKIYWTKTSVFIPDFIIECIRNSVHKKWNWWWICKNLPLKHLQELAIIDGAKIDMDGVSANINLTADFYISCDKDFWKFNNKFLCANPAFTPQQLLDIGVEIDNHYLSKNPNLTREFVDAHDEINWNIRYLTLNPGTKESFFKDPPPGFICYINYSDRKEITPQFYLENESCFYNWNVLAEKFPFEFIRNEIDTKPNSPFHNCWNHISMNKDVSMTTVKKYPDYPWCYRTMCFNPNVKPEEMKERYVQFTEELVMEIKAMNDEKYLQVLLEKDDKKLIEEITNELQHIHGDQIQIYFSICGDVSNYQVGMIQKTSEWDELFKLDIIDIDTIKTYIGNRQFRKYRDLNSQKYYVDVDIINAKIKNDVSWFNLTHNPNLTMKFVIDNPKKDFDWKYLSQIVNTETIKKYPSDLWDMEIHSQYADVDLAYVEKNKRKVCWSWKGLSKNKNFDYQTIWKNRKCDWHWHVVFSLSAYNNRMKE